MNTSGKRNAGIELLRIVSMLMVISLHYINKGGARANFGEMTLNSVLAEVINSLCLVAVNAYVFISGYFMVSSDFHFRKAVRLWLQILFYSGGIFLILLIAGKIPEVYLEKYFYLEAFMPLTTQHYWFATIYVALYFLSPFLAVLAKKLSRRELGTLVVVLLLLFSRLWKIVLPQSYPLDDRGYGILWFLTLFFTAAYIRLYGDHLTKKWLYLGGYFLFAFLNFGSVFAIGYISEITGHFSNFIYVFDEYNAPFTIAASVCLFLFFKNVSLKESASRIVLFIAPATFGVYLLHEHFLLRDLWVTFWKVNEGVKTPWFILHYLGTVFAVFAIGIFVDKVRGLLFGIIGRTGPVKKLSAKLDKLDSVFPSQKA